MLGWTCLFAAVKAGDLALPFRERAANAIAMLDNGGRYRKPRVHFTFSPSLGLTELKALRDEGALIMSIGDGFPGRCIATQKAALTLLDGAVAEERRIEAMWIKAGPRATTVDVPALVASQSRSQRAIRSFLESLRPTELVYVEVWDEG